MPSVFGPAGSQVLDLACGTGIIAREAAALLGPRGSITGVDLNARMLEIARANAPQDGARVEWHQGDATALPFAAECFDVLLCQQGLQFFPDKPAALREMRRVLKPGGRAGLCVWQSIEHSPCHLAIAATLHRHINADTAQRFRAPFAFGDEEALRAALLAAQFRDVRIEVATVMRRLLPPAESIPALLASTPVGPEVAALDDATRSTFVAEVAEALSAYRDEQGMIVPQQTLIAIATA